MSRYTDGDCDLLARALSQETGWPVVLAIVEDGGWTHAAVQRPDGQILDIEGAHDPDAWIDAWDDTGEGYIARAADVPKRMWPDSRLADITEEVRADARALKLRLKDA